MVEQLPGTQKVAGSIHGLCLAKSRGVPEQDTLTPTAPDELAVAFHGLTPPSVYECTCECKAIL